MSNQNVVTFRAKGTNQNRVLMAKTLRIDLSEILNDLLEKHGDVEIKKRMADAQREAIRLQKEVERAKGFEPSTFTLAR
jgi:flagellar biosynthesis protein FlhB